MSRINRIEVQTRIDYVNGVLARMSKKSRYELHNRKGFDTPWYIEITMNGESVDYPVMYGSLSDCYDYMRGAVKALDIVIS